ncbi:MAG: WD40/YVTN/BNR-like repeat-containing protein, partial [Haliscomenobacter sp.]
MKLRLSLLLLLCARMTLAQLPGLKNLPIRNIGPANMSGRITAVDAVHANPKIIFAAAASGGVWKSENGGSAWKPVFDEQPTQNIGSVRIQQSNPNVVWVGTGEGNPRNSMNLGRGIFRSRDGGKTWQCLGLEATKTIHRILIDPSDSNTVYAGAMGDPFTPGPHRGLYKTSDGGKTWTRILFT